jgi:hypothetical protein
VVALDVGSCVEPFCAVVDGGVVGEAAGERLAEMVDGGVVGDEARGFDERLRGMKATNLRWRMRSQMMSWICCCCCGL